MITYWQNEARITKQILRDIQTYVGDENYDQVKLRKLISNMAREVDISQRLLARVERNEWFTREEIEDNREYGQLIKESNALIDDLFPKNDRE